MAASTAISFAQQVGGRGVPTASGGTNCGGVPGGTNTTGCGGVPGSLGTYLTATITNASSTYGTTGGGLTTRYNDQYAGQNGLASNSRYTSGDTRAYTVLSNGTLVGTLNDGVGGSNVGAGVGRNIVVQTITNNNLQEATLNSFDDYGIESCTYNGTQGQNTCTNNAGSWTDGATWKTGGIWSRGTRLYLSVYRQLDTNPFTGQNSSLLMSTDNGNTWCNYTHDVSQACSGNSSVSGLTADVPTNGQQMWTSTAIRAPQEIYYCQAETSCGVVDTNNTYAYLTTMDQNEQHLYLLRIPVGSDFQNVANYQYSTGSNTWSSTVGSAVPIVSFGNAHTGFLASQVVYDYGLQLYLEVVATGGGCCNGMIAVASAPHPWGPWTVTSLIPNNDLQLNFTALVTSSRTTANGCAQYLLGTDGPYTYQQPTYPLVNNYSTQLQQIKLCLTGIPAATPASGILATNLYQEFQFQPASAGNIPDSSGNSHNGTPTEFPGYVTQGDSTPWGNNSNYDIDTGNTYTGTNFTATMVFRHQNSAVNFEKLFGNATASGTQGNFYCQRDAAAVDAYQCVVDQGGTMFDFYMSDDVWQELILVRSGTTTTIYDANSFNGGTATPLAVFTSGSNPLAGDITLGTATGCATCYFNGQFAYWNFYSAALTPTQLIANQAIINPLMQAKGIYLAQPITTLPLDNLAALGAWSLRKVRTAYAGNAVNVKRASDSTSTDIGFSGNSLNTAALGTFCSGTTCSVNTWYDQSGNGYNAGCTASPLIYSGGAVLTSGGQPAIQFNGSTQYCTTPSSFYYFGIYATAMAVANYNASAQTFSSLMGWIAATGTLPQTYPQNAIPLIKNGTTQQIAFDRASTILSPSNTFSYGSPSLMASTFGSQLQRVFLDAAGVATNNVIATPPARFYLNSIQLGNDAGVSQSFYGLLSEEYVWPYALGQEAYNNLQANTASVFGTPNPITYLSTTFSEASSGSPLAGTTPAVCQNGCTGSWTAATNYPTTNPWQYVNGGVVGAGQCLAAATYCPATMNVGQTNYTVRWNYDDTLNATNDSFAVQIRWTNAANNVWVGCSGSAMFIFDIVAGVATQEATGGTCAPGLYSIVASGTSITVNTPGGSISGTVSSSNTGTSVGFENYGSGATLRMNMGFFSVKSY